MSGQKGLGPIVLHHDDAVRPHLMDRIFPYHGKKTAPLLKEKGDARKGVVGIDAAVRIIESRIRQVAETVFQV